MATGQLSQKTRSGFTLVELATVAAIVAILGAVLFAVVARAKSSGHYTTCLSNLSQMGKAHSLYALDYSDTLPACLTPICVDSDLKGGDVRKPAHLWRGMIKPYGLADGQFFCPKDPHAHREFKDGWADHTASSYLHWVGITANGMPVVATTIGDPTKTPLMLEDAVEFRRKPDSNNSYGIGPHDGLSNIVYFDGHVKAFKSP
ncbi:MAG: prepilin-type N-terminal cleavage/methylation domain-containing protein [Fimbriimonadaceae bacterium]|nr:prepilin-type N-terminal cleavage/methylation domain-containing protein [Fimbriimonadaceae bacterium]QYK57147.1 MAG: prepilin-type N-terminal cleavage/methylation domain-containing protein [Fimbriimonadaceae bacterium]